MSIIQENGYSADVEIYLQVDGQTLRVAQVGPDSLILREPASLKSSSTARIVIKVNGNAKSKDVFLFEGACLDSKQVNFF